jgi:hypothetical protein
MPTSTNECTSNAGYRISAPAVYAREGRVLGIRQPLGSPVFQKLQDAKHWCIHAMINHYDGRLGMSDARIETFNGMVDCGPGGRDMARTCEHVAKEKREDGTRKAHHSPTFTVPFAPNKTQQVHQEEIGVTEARSLNGAEYARDISCSHATKNVRSRQLELF